MSAFTCQGSIVSQLEPSRFVTTTYEVTRLLALGLVPFIQSCVSDGSLRSASVRRIPSSPRAGPHLASAALLCGFGSTVSTLSKSGFPPFCISMCGRKSSTVVGQYGSFLANQNEGAYLRTISCSCVCERFHRSRRVSTPFWPPPILTTPSCCTAMFILPSPL